MNILILGSGGREHALAWRISKDSSCEQVFVWPGNEGMEGAKISIINQSFDKENLLRFLQEKRIQLVVPGAEKFLYEGVEGWCEEAEVPCFGPSIKAAELERSKLFAKNVMTKAGVPTSRFKDITSYFQENIERAIESIRVFKKPVIKISGPALGKGVFVCEHQDEAAEILYKIKEQGAPGLEEGLLVEEGVSGQEVSMFFACHGTNFSYLGSAQDHKRLLDNDEGPNTGGMGAISPVSWVNDDFISDIIKRVVTPTLEAMKEQGTPFKGMLFLGLMVDGEEVNLLEYNTRFGDPETQALLPLIDGDFTSFLHSMATGKESSIKLTSDTSVHIVKAARGYPGLFGVEIEKGAPIHFSKTSSPNSQVFFAGVKRAGEGMVTNGGRVLGATSWGPSKHDARISAYEALSSTRFEGEQYRRDIGKKL